MSNPTLTQVQLEAIEGLQLFTIAQLIKREWKKPYFGAVPYINAMLHLNSVTDSYGAEDGKSMVLYFLSNAGSWRGDVARVVKAELKRRIK